MEYQKEIYKVGDIVYYLSSYLQCMKGEVVKIDIKKEYPVGVLFEKTNEINRFTENGFYLKAHRNPSLSFAPYDIINGGFTQERPLPKIEVDTLVYIRFYPNYPWEMRYFSHFKDEKMYVFSNQEKSELAENSFYAVSKWSLTNPLENEK